MIYADCVVADTGAFSNDQQWARPTTVLWMMDEILLRDTDNDRHAWVKAETRGKKAVEHLLGEWGLQHDPWRAHTTREPLRDETWPAWRDVGAVRVLTSRPKSSPMGTWALSESFAGLFNPAIDDSNFASIAAKWRNEHLDRPSIVRLRLLRQREQAESSVSVKLPNGQSRTLAPGDASFILKNVVEQWLPQRLVDPWVLTISEPGDKFYVGDKALMESLGLKIDVNSLLPDALFVDVGVDPIKFWIVEAVASDGPVSEARKRKLEEWAAEQNIPVESCNYMSAYVSRDSAPARKNLNDLAVGTYAWYADEPTRELSWLEIPGHDVPDNVTPLSER